MSQRNALSETELREALQQLTEWKTDGGALLRIFTFKDFRTAFAFMSSVALAAEKADHHPDWRNVYNRVEVRLSTHDAKAITAKDTALATTITSIYEHGFR
jgi:4a-hydroxytetrahydrobiopterin dehydratase